MQVKKEVLEPTKLKLTMAADQALLDAAKQRAVAGLSRNVKVPGFRPGSAPAALVEKQLDPAGLQQEFLEQAVNDLYVAAVDQEKVRPVAQPQISVTKFVPFSTLVISAEVEAVGAVTLPDYTKINIAKKPVNITEKQIDDVIKNLQSRVAAKKAVTTAAKKGDEVVIDFAGTDTKSKEPVAGAAGKDYPLTLGSGNFIPGFEDQLVGLKAGAKKTFDIIFPKDYGVQAMQGQKVTFDVTVKTVNQVSQPKVDDKFAAQVGPFKTIAELRKDIRRELTQQQSAEYERQFENELLEKIAAQTKVAIPPALIDEEIDRMEQQDRQNVAYRGQTWQEHLAEEGVTAEEHKAKNRPAAELRVKAGLVLGEIADKEKIVVAPEELEIRLQLLKGQYKEDKAMQAELDKPENRRDILNRMLTEKTLDKLKSYQ